MLKFKTIRRANKLLNYTCSTCVNMCINKEKPFCDSPDSTKVWIKDIYSEKCCYHDDGRISKCLTMNG